MLYRVRKIAALALLVLVLPFASVKAQSDILWSQSYGGEQDETFQDIFITNDNGAQVIGYGQSNIGDIKSGKGLYDMVICEMTANGELAWTSNIGGTKNDLGKSILIEDNKTFVGGLTYSTDLDVKFNLGGGDIFFGNLDDQQQVDQSTLLGGNKLDNIVGIQMQSDGSIILVANTNSTDVADAGVGGATDIYICRLLPDGTLIWDKTIGSNGVDKAADLIINSKDEIIIVGTTFSDNFIDYKKGIKDAFVLCLSENGEQVWGKRFTNGNYSSFVACDADSRDNIVITGIQGSINNSSSGINGIYNEDIWVLKIDETGDELWRKFFGGINNDFATDIISSLDGGMLVVGHTESYDGLVIRNNGNKDAFALKLDTDGDKLWSKGYGGDKDDLIFAATQDKKGHYWLVGHTSSEVNDISENNGGSDAWILKLEGERPKLQIELGDAIEACEGEPLQIDATLDFCDCEYNWSDGVQGANRTIIAYNSTSLELTIIDEEGNSAIDEIEIIIHPSPKFDLSTTPPNCTNSEDGSITVDLIDAALPLQYNWNTNNNENLLSDLGAGSYTLTLTDGNSCSSVAEVNIEAPNPLAISASISSAICNTNSGEIAVDISGGLAPYSYEWSNGTNQSEIAALSPGIYSTIVSDVNGCIIEGEFEVKNEDIDFDLLYEVTNNSCFAGEDGEIKILNSEGIESFAWSNGATSEDLNALRAGEYELNYITVDGCSGTQAFQISEPSILEPLSSANHNNCDYTNIGSIGLELRGGTPPYFFEWSTGATTPFITGLSQGVYSVTITDANNCEKILVQEVTTPPSIELTGLQVSNETCPDEEDGFINLEIEGGTGSFTYQWSNGNNTSLNENLTAGTYSVTVTDEFGCSFFTQATIEDADEFPVIIIEQENPTCDNSNNGVASFSSQDVNANLSYLWSDGFAESQRSDLPAGNYVVTITSSSGCTSTEQFNLESPPSLSMNFNINPISCFKDSNATIEAIPSGGTPPYDIEVRKDNLSILTLNNEQIAENLSSGNYLVLVTDDNGCSLQLPVSIYEPENIIIQGIVTDASCYGKSDGAIETIVSGGVGTLDYFWGGNSTENNLEEIPAGIYLVEITDDNGCFKKRTFQVKQPEDLTVNSIITQPSSSNDNGSIELEISGGTEPYQIHWLGGAAGPNISGLGSGEYQYEITDNNNCTSAGNITLEATTSASKFIPFGSLSIYPNPVDKLLHIVLDGSYQDLQINLYNTLGQTMHFAEFSNFNKTNYQIPVSQLPSGLYQLSISNRTHQSSIKVIVSH